MARKLLEGHLGYNCLLCWCLGFGAWCCHLAFMSKKELPFVRTGTSAGRTNSKSKKKLLKKKKKSALCNNAFFVFRGSVVYHYHAIMVRPRLLLVLIPIRRLSSLQHNPCVQPPLIHSHRATAMFRLVVNSAIRQVVAPHSHCAQSWRHHKSSGRRFAAAHTALVATARAAVSGTL